MAYVEINKSNISKNARHLLNLTGRAGVEMASVTKVVCGDPEIVSKIIEAGVREIGESRLENIDRIRTFGLSPAFLLLRLPSPQLYRKVVESVDSVLLSELKSLKALKELSEEMGRRLKFIYMVDTGDLREGVMYDRAFEELGEAAKIAGRSLDGIGTNLGCFGGVIATPEKFEILLALGDRLRREDGIEIERYSAGNTASLPLIENGTLPRGINHYRLGESIMCGTDVTNSRAVPGTTRETFTLYGTVLELKRKPSVPIGEIGSDAFGRKPHFEDMGERLKAILDIGEQDVVPSGLTPMLEGCRVLHASSDHLIVDVTDCPEKLSVDDRIPFRMSYGALLRVMTSRYIAKEYRDLS